MNEFQEGGSGKSQDEQKLYQHTFVVSLQQIVLKSDFLINCVVKYNYSLFCSSQVTTAPSFKVAPNSENTDIPPEKGFKEFKLSTEVSAQNVKNFMSHHPLNIEIFDDLKLLGRAKVDLNELLYEEEPERIHQESFRRWITVLFDDQIVGRINGLFVLVAEPWSRCKSCKETFKSSTILKHVNHRANKSCQKNFSPEELESLNVQSEMLKRQKRSEYARKNYDASKRHEMHLKKYDSGKRASDFLKAKQKRRQYLKDKLAEEAYENLKLRNDSLESDARHENEKERNSEKQDLKRFLQRFSLSLPSEAKVKVASMEGAIDDLYQQIEAKINKLVEKAKHLTVRDIDGHRGLYSELYLRFPKEHPNYSNTLGHDWNDLRERNYLAMKGICEGMGQPPPEPSNLWICLHEKCKICCNKIICHHGNNVHNK